MALEFNKIQPVRFGDFEAVPKVTTSAKMRLREISFKTQEEISESKSILAGCFGKNEDKVLDFMNENMSTFDMQRLQAYLLGGDAMLDTFDKAIQEAMSLDNLKKEVDDARD